MGWPFDADFNIGPRGAPNNRERCKEARARAQAANAAPPCCLSSAWAPPGPFFLFPEGMERREAPGVCEAPRWQPVLYFRTAGAILPEWVCKAHSDGFARPVPRR